MSSQAARRGRLTRTGSSATEDQTLNQIAHEAEARLSAKRAARAEARNIRMKELERQQKEAEDEIDKQFKMTNNGVGRSVSAGAISNLVNDEKVEANGPLVPEKVLKSAQDNLRDAEDKYRKTMVSIAQLDNEKQALLYQVDCLKDRMAEEEEISCEIKNELKDKTKECDRHLRTIKERDEQIQRLKDAIEFRDNWLSERGLSMFNESSKDEEESTHPDVNSWMAVSGSDRGSVSESNRSRSGSHDSSEKVSVSEEKEALVAELRKLQDELLILKREEDHPKAITADLEELRREFTRQINDFRIKLQKAEQENARLEGVVMRLESQVKRYKTQAEAAVSTEDDLKSENRKLNRELRKAQDEVSELQTVNDHLQKRLDKMKSRRKEEL
ncbi:leucine-rich repeat flightless-interacting protein 2-like [Actinia tenebrosa]|uniref:Leucine-rich repeat flightless-interacting protein 2-like n=1 Tax=Actinia tenebrosa TaxID=6105 RepID=A0A6P8HS56_ACTTE|nr:leucine-rich repeat flightless-interacting protein 2-like [Actinia tenebrosa]